MTDFSLSSGSVCRPINSPWGNFPTHGYQVASTLAAKIVIGQPVQILGESDGSSNGHCVKGITAPNWFNMVGFSAETVSSGASSAVAGPVISVWEANPNVEFRAVTKGGPLGTSLCGKRRSLQWDSTLNIAWVDVTASTAADWRVVVTRLIDQPGDSGGYVAFRCITNLSGGQIGSSVAVTSTSPVLAYFG